ncbi:MAG TPA: tRNA (guanosine(46)-N7)-methyltransferase TrmB [Gemmataceae bacterium]|nr:tRNA (guanosine(46)-N7)-methyltransferase TrmB [Gemmataceae bacterium]
MRKPRRLPREEMDPFVWELPRGQRSEVRGQSSEDGDSASGSSDLRPLTSDALDWSAFFGNPNPVEIEVGMGKGLFLLTAALARPGTNFLGIEIVRKYQLYAATRYAVRKLPNIKTACADAFVVLRDHVATGSVAAVHVYFPDPWWKTRHRKRRVFRPEFAAEAARVLKTGGVLHIATDVEEYFGVMTGIVRAMPAFREMPVETGQGGYQTNFERKAQLKGTPVWRAAFERTTGDVTIPRDPTEAGERGA